ncbi:MAG: hypothetical protein QM270_02345 [Bacillota bacterium]|nr:hypothetical protein [Bacillota bacterium]
MISLGSQREFFWDNYLIDTEKTTASHVVHRPVRRNIVKILDRPWEGDGCNYYNMVYDRKTRSYYLYYLAWEMLNPEGTQHTMADIHVCMMNSRDGLHWERPSLGLYEFAGSRDNNIVLMNSAFPGMISIDNFFVSMDENPDPVVPERFKATMAYWRREEDGSHYRALYSLVSEDGIHFRHLGVITEKGRFDSLNVLQWSPRTRLYHCYVRDFHHPADENGVLRDVAISEEHGLNEAVRDIRVLTSEDFIHWTEPQKLQFNDVEDHPLYTSCISLYPRNRNVMVGFPTRYVERKQWTENFDRLCGAEKRRQRSTIHPRYGLVTTDCVFMCSRDGLNWFRHDDAFIRPGPEHPLNWVYGDCYPAVGLIESPSDIPGADPEMSLLLFENHWSGLPAQIVRYSLRWDGFVSLHAGIRPQRIVTRTFTFEGSQLGINFETSARGWVRLSLRNMETGKEFHSGELFGNRIDRIVDFDGELVELRGIPVVMEIELCDADMYAFKFGD